MSREPVPSPPPAVDYSRKWLVMVAVGVGILMSTLDGNIVNVALPTLVRTLGATFPVVQWVVLAYLLTQATLLLVVGRLADMRGKKRLYAAGYIIFTAGSFLCALAPDAYWLIAFRVVQAVGAAPILALGIAIVTESFPPSERGKALGIAGGTVSVGVVLGPALGGLILDAFSWHWIFLVNVPVGIAGTLLALRFVPDVRPPGAERFDLVGAVLLFAGLLSLLLALTLGQQLTFTAPLILALFAAFFVALALFIRHELGHPQPLIDLRLFRNLHFSVNLAAGFITFVAIAGSVILVPFYLEGVLGLSTRDVGLLLAVTPMVLAVTAPLAGSLSDRLGTRPITVTGLLILAAGYALMSTLDADVTTLGFIARFLPVGIGMGVFQSPNNSAVMGAAPRERLGIASGLLAITRSLGQTAGIAVLGALWAARVFAAVGQTLPGGATAAPPSAQVVALHETFLGVTALMLLALGLNVWAWQRERRQAQQAYASTH